MRLELALIACLALALAVWLVPAASATYGKGRHKSTAAANVVHGIPGAAGGGGRQREKRTDPRGVQPPQMPQPQSKAAARG